MDFDPAAESKGDQPRGPAERSETFDATVEEIRRRLGSNNFNPVAHLEDLGRRRLGLAPMSASAAMLAGLFGIGIRLALALLADAIAGQGSPIPWARWAVILIFYGLYDGTQPFRTPLLDVPIGPQDWRRRWMEDFTALLPTIEREADLRDLAAFARRWFRFQVSSTVGVVVATIMLVTCWLVAPTEMSELPPGSIVLLTMLLFDFGASTVTPSDVATLTRETRFEHRLFWPSPADSPEVQKSMRMAAFFGRSTGVWITLHLVLAVALVSSDSPLIVPLAAGYVVIGYVYTFVSVAIVRSAIQRIVQQSRNRRLERIRHRIEAFEDRFDDLTPEESEQVRALIDLHNTIRDAPTTPTTSRTLFRNAAGLILPTIVFIITVLGEVSAERILDAILP